VCDSGCVAGGVEDGVVRDAKVVSEESNGDMASHGCCRNLYQSKGEFRGRMG
jgi:hypothetical protein